MNTCVIDICTSPAEAQAVLTRRQGENFRLLATSSNRQFVQVFVNLQATPCVYNGDDLTVYMWEKP